MEEQRRFVVSTFLLAGVALAHALLTWPLRSTLVLFLGGATIAFVAEAVVIRLGLLGHHARPTVAGVPIVVLLAWPATVYVFYRAVTLFVPGGIRAAALAALLATLVDGVLDPVGVRRGRWTYPDVSISEPRFRGVPWWNFVGWLVIVFLTAMLMVRYG